MTVCTAVLAPACKHSIIVRAWVRVQLRAAGPALSDGHGVYGQTVAIYNLQMILTAHVERLWNTHETELLHWPVRVSCVPLLSAVPV